LCVTHGTRRSASLRCSFEVGDAAEEADIVRILADVSNRTGGTLDVLVNNAGSHAGFGLVSTARVVYTCCFVQCARM
jgi:NAD(P)-dependent dehydrogenase (short-subunit alcohol dehydrogenase family)